VQNTFIEVVAEDNRCASVRRVRSAPAAPAPSAVEHEQGHWCGAAEGLDAEVDRLGQAADFFGTFASSAAGPDGAEHAEDRTTVLVRNLPPSYTRDLLLELLDSHGFSGLYDFVYVPFEFNSGTTFGFAFVNLTKPEHAARFRAVFEGFSSWQVHCDREMAVGWSFAQGYEAHVDRYRNSPIMHDAMPDGCKPVVFESGARAKFPLPTKRLPLLRRQRRRPNPSGARAPTAAAPPGEHDLQELPAGGAARGSLLAAGLYPGAGEIPEPGDEGLSRAALRPGRQAPPGRAAPSWADLSEDAGGPEGLLRPALCPRQELRPRSPARRAPSAAVAVAGCRSAGGTDQHSESSTDVPKPVMRAGAFVKEASSSQLSSASGSELADVPRHGPRRGKRAGRRSAKSSASAAPWNAGSILLPGLVACTSLGDGPLTSIVDEHEAP
ncbi:unnamed protein product, partial [Prorocentrum cordatum]